MNNGGDAAEQVVRLSLEGFEVAAKLSGLSLIHISEPTRVESVYYPQQGLEKVYGAGKALRCIVLRTQGQKHQRRQRAD